MESTEKRFGTCKLCHETKDLVATSLYPEALLRMADTNLDTIVFSEAEVRHVSAYVTDYILCATCIDSMRAVERWVADLSLQPNGDFRLRDILSHYIVNSENLMLKLASAKKCGIDSNRLANFALYFLWRTAAHVWAADKSTFISTDLSRYEEVLRLYLIHGAPLPESIAVIITLANVDCASNRLLTLPMLERRAGFHCYKIIVPGILFNISIGSRLPPEIRAFCSIRSSEKYIGLRDYLLSEASRGRPQSVPKGKVWCDGTI